MDGTKGSKETRVTAPGASNALGVNVFTAPGKIAEVESDPELLSDLACEICEIILAEADDRTKRKNLLA
jgi:hypothetical protein